MQRWSQTAEKWSRLQWATKLSIITWFLDYLSIFSLFPTKDSSLFFRKTDSSIEQHNNSSSNSNNNNSNAACRLTKRNFLLASPFTQCDLVVDQKAGDLWSLGSSPPLIIGALLKTITRVLDLKCVNWLRVFFILLLTWGLYVKELDFTLVTKNWANY